MTAGSGTIPLSRSLDKPPYNFTPLSFTPALELKPPSSQFLHYYVNSYYRVMLLFLDFDNQNKLDDSKLIITHGLTSSKYHTAKVLQAIVSLLEEVT